MEQDAQTSRTGAPSTPIIPFSIEVLKLPDHTKVYPGHDYKGDTVSTIGEERAFNPRLQVSSANEYADLMSGLTLANPKMMDVAVPANLSIGQSLTIDPEIVSATVTVEDAILQIEGNAVLFIDLRETRERQVTGIIPWISPHPLPVAERRH